MKYFAAILMLLFSLSANADGVTTDTLSSAGFSKLTDAQKAEILSAVSQKAAEKSPDIVSAPEKVNAWLDIGTRIGQGFAGAAKELGIAVNEFAKTPVGQMTTFLIIWHFMGSMVIHVVSGAVIFVVGMGICYMIYRSATRRTITYDEKNQDLLGRNRILSIQNNGISDDAGWAVLWIFVLTLVVSIFTTFSW